MAEFGNFINGLYGNIKSFTEVAAEKTSEAIEISKLRVEHLKIKGRIQSNYERLGEIVYGGQKNGEDVSDATNVLFEQLDDDFARIEEIYELINAYKNDKDDDEAEEEDDEAEVIEDVEEIDEKVEKIKNSFDDMVD